MHNLTIRVSSPAQRRRAIAGTVPVGVAQPNAPRLWHRFIAASMPLPWTLTETRVTTPSEQREAIITGTFSDVMPGSEVSLRAYMDALLGAHSETAPQAGPLFSASPRQILYEQIPRGSGLVVADLPAGLTIGLQPGDIVRIDGHSTPMRALFPPEKFRWFYHPKPIRYPEILVTEIIAAARWPDASRLDPSASIHAGGCGINAAGLRQVVAAFEKINLAEWEQTRRRFRLLHAWLTYRNLKAHITTDDLDILTA